MKLRVEYWFERTNLGDYRCSVVHHDHDNEWHEVASLLHYSDERFWNDVSNLLAAGKIVKLKPFPKFDLIFKISRVGSKWSYEQVPATTGMENVESPHHVDYSENNVRRSCDT